MADSIRPLVKAIEAELRDPDIPLSRIAAHSMSLSSLLSSITAHVRGCEMAYKRVLVAKRAECKSAADAAMQAEVTDEYEAWQESKDMHASVMELIRTLRKALDALREEARMKR